MLYFVFFQLRILAFSLLICIILSCSCFFWDTLPDPCEQRKWRLPEFVQVVANSHEQQVMLGSAPGM